MRTIVALGAYSSIVESTLRNFAKDHDNFFLVGKDKKKLSIVADDLRARGASDVEIFAYDLSATDAPQIVFDEATKVFQSIDLLYLGYGVLSEELESINVNFNSAVSHIDKWLNYFMKRTAGTIAVITSVAGDRGRKGNFIYGCAKGGLSTYLEGLRSKVISQGINIVTIKPGFVDTPMTAQFKKGALFASSEVVGQTIYKCIVKGGGTYYVPGFWRIIMGIIKLIPESILRKLPI